MSNWDFEKRPDLVIGAPVTVWRQNGWNPESAHPGRTIAKIGKLKITLDDGSEFRTRGFDQWGGGDGYIAKPNLKDEAEANTKFRHAVHSNYLRNTDFTKLPASLVALIYRQVKDELTKTNTVA